jgi:hypothetical protein
MARIYSKRDKAKHPPAKPRLAPYVVDESRVAPLCQRNRVIQFRHDLGVNGVCKFCGHDFRKHLTRATACDK